MLCRAAVPLAAAVLGMDLAPSAEVGLGGEVVEGVFREAAAGTATLSSSAADATAAAACVRRRSTMVSLELRQASASKGSALWFFYQQVRSQAYLTGIALLMTLCSLPLGLSIEPMIVELASLVTMLDTSQSVPCEGLLMDDRGVNYTAGCLIGISMGHLSASLMVTAAAPHMPRTLPHWLAGSAANSAISTFIPGTPTQLAGKS